MDNPDNNHVVKYCVTAVIDLLGFSIHLEVGRNDLRTNIGQEALNRLQILEQALQLMDNDRTNHPDGYPKDFYFTRINDAIILCLDVPDLLRPEVGEPVKKGFSINELEVELGMSTFTTFEEFQETYQFKLMGETENLIKFIGLVSRLHVFVNNKENSAFFPGAKTIVAAGYRTPFVSGKNQDFLSANFSFSNAIEADKHLHGPKLFLDNHISQLISTNKFARNLIRFACYVRRHAQFDPFREYDDVFYLEGDQTLSTSVEFTLFRVPFSFRELDPVPLQYLQTINPLLPYLTSKDEPQVKKYGWWLRLFKAIQAGPTPSESGEVMFPLRLIVDIENDIWLFPQTIEGDSQNNTTEIPKISSM